MQWWCDCILAGNSDSVKLSTVPKHHEARVESGMDLGEEGDNLDNGGGSGHRTRRLFQVQAEDPTQLQEEPSSGWPASWSSLQHAVHQLLQGGCPHFLGTGTYGCFLCIPDCCRPIRHLQQDRQTPQELQVPWTRTRLHLWPCQGCSLHCLPFWWSQAQNSGLE